MIKFQRLWYIASRGLLFFTVHVSGIDGVTISARGDTGAIHYDGKV